MIRASIKLRLKFGDVERAADKAKNRAFARYGGYARRVMRSSLKRRRGKTERGQSPADRTKAIKSHIYFSRDKAADSVVIGPEKLSKGGEGLGWLESEFPFVGPAQQAADKKLPEFWGNSIHG
jgi:hypothetical protein